MRVDQFQNHAVLGFVDWTLRGVGQVVFQNNPVAGLVILIGAELNAEIEHQTLVDSTTGAPAPMGARGAKMADTIGKTV